MMKKKTLLTAILLSLVGCAAYVPQPHNVTELVPPADEKGRSCANECQKLFIMQKQLINAEFVSNRLGQGEIGRRTDEVMRDIDIMTVEGNYNSCVIDLCGGKMETKTVIY
jgi:hypothetical protein